VLDTVFDYDEAGRLTSLIHTERIGADSELAEFIYEYDPQGSSLGGGSQVYIPKVNPNWLGPTR
jgi:hypothetical protein